MAPALSMLVAFAFVGSPDTTRLRPAARSRRPVASPAAALALGQALRPQLRAVARRVPEVSLVYKTEDPTPMVELYANGRVNEYSSTLASMRGRYKLSTRDMRLLRSSTRVLAPREGYILIDLGDLKGVIQHDCLTLIGADRPAVSALAKEVKQRLVLDDTASLRVDEAAPFEVRVVECMLEQTYTLLEEALQRLEALVTTTLAELTDPARAQSEARREAALGRLLPLQISLKALGARAERLASVLEELLESDEDLADMCLTSRHERQQLELLRQQADEAADGSAEAVAEALVRAEARGFADTSDARQAGEGADAADDDEEAEGPEELVETLLDVYNSRLDSLTDRIRQLATNIETTQVTLELQLDNERNRIARLELTLNMAGLCVGVSAMISGFFGMNLSSGVELIPYGFVIATIVSLLMSVGMFAACTRRFRVLSSEQRARLYDVQALKTVLANVDAVALLLRAQPTTDVARLLTGSGAPHMSARELALLQSVLQHQLPTLGAQGAQGAQQLDAAVAAARDSLGVTPARA